MGPAHPPFYLEAGWEDNSTKIQYAGDCGEDELSRQEAAAVAYLEGVGHSGDPDKRTAESVGETLRVSRGRASEILNSARRKERVDYDTGKNRRHEWFAMSGDKSDSGSGQND